MGRQLVYKDIMLIGRTFDEYCRMFDLDGDILGNGKILDAASGVSSFCAEANARGWNAMASDKIYVFSPAELEQRCRTDLDHVIEQLTDAEDLFIWDYFKDIPALKTHRQRAYSIFLDDFKKYGTARYVPVEYPRTEFTDGQFTISLVSHLLFLYEHRLSYDFHKNTILELARITSREIRIFPIVNLNGKRSAYIKMLMRDLDHFRMTIKKVGYEFMRNTNEMLIIQKEQ